MQTQITYKNIRYFLLAATVFIGCKCKKNIEPDTVCTDANTIKIPQDAKDRFFFLNGSYWIYKDSLSNLTDSVWVTESLVDNVNREKENPFSKGKCFELCTYTVNSTLQNIYGSGINASATKTGTAYNNEYFYLIYGSPLIDFSRLRYRGVLMDTFNFEGGIVSTIDSLSIDNVIYRDIILVSYAKQSIDPLKRIYYANKIGIVKFEERTNGKVWELIRYNIEQ